MTKIINSFSTILDKYDFFILDQWGVMHDGQKGYKHAINAVNKLIIEDKKLVIISNSSKRKISSINSLKNLGFNKKHFVEVMTSGEMIWHELLKSNKIYKNNFKNCFHIFDKSKEDSLDFRNGLEKFKFVTDIKDANFILGCTPFENTEPLDYIPILKDALQLNLTFFCANPDFVTIQKEKNVFCMGTISDLYDRMGGNVITLGKPSIEIYLESFKKIKELQLSKIVAIGDSLDHDILGANNFGIDSVLITSGIHKNMFRDSYEKGLKKLKNNKKWIFEPTYLCKNFSI